MFYNNYPSLFYRFNEEVLKYIGADLFVLHLGCGADESIGLRTRARTTIGIDLDKWILQNSDINFGLIGDVAHLPFADGSFDVVIARWVLEHLTQPDLAFKEAGRVLRPRGYFLVITPNLWHYAGAIIRMTPQRIQRWFVKSLLRGNPGEVFPTYYRANSTRQIKHLMNISGLVEERIEMLEATPTLLSFSPITYLAGIAYERMVNRFEFLSGFRSAILGIFRKLK